MIATRITVEVKTTGYLISEFITIGMKEKFAKDDIQRKQAVDRKKLLSNAIDARLRKLLNDGEAHNRIIKYTKLYKNLYAALEACWSAQEVVMDSLDPQEVYTAAKTTLIENKKRNEAIRALDELFGESYYSHLEKTYKV